MVTRTNQGRALEPRRVWMAGLLAIAAISVALFLASSQRAAGNPIMGFTQVSAGGTHTCALQNGTGVVCWGANNTGQIGDGTNVDRAVPTAVEGLPKDVVLVRAGTTSSCAADSRGGIWCWGGMYETIPALTHQFSGGVIDLALSVEGYLDCALTNTLGVHCWSVRHGSAPGVVIMPAKEASAISAGGGHACGVISGSATCWGSNEYGQLGDGTAAFRQHPAEALGIDGDVIAVSLGIRHSCALTIAGDVWCWGNNSQGQLGDGTNETQLIPVRSQTVSHAVRLDAGGNGNCALTDVEEVLCWGGLYGAEQDVISIPGKVVDISVGLDHACALIEDGRVHCWGSTGGGKLGAGEEIQGHASVDVSDGETKLGTEPSACIDSDTCLTAIPPWPTLPCEAQACMGLAVLGTDGGAICHSSQQETCRLQAGSQFALVVDVVAPPNDGYVLVQSFIDFGIHIEVASEDGAGANTCSDGQDNDPSAQFASWFVDRYDGDCVISNLTYTPSAIATEELVWPDKGFGLRAEFAIGLVNHGGITGLIPPLAVSNYVGPIVRMAMTCSPDYSETTVRIVPDGDRIAVTSGALFTGPQGERTVPAIGSLEVICGEDK